MSKLWEGRLHGALSPLAETFNSSISFDFRMYNEDIEGSVAHAFMLCEKGVLSVAERERIVAGLREIQREIQTETLSFDPKAEDIHSFIETELTKRIGDCGKKLHTARSRNDQVALDLRMYLRKETDAITALLRRLMQALVKKAKTHTESVMPGYTHMQRAQPVTFAHHLLAYVSMLERDCERFADAKKRINVSPIGSVALAGTTYDTDRFYEALALGFEKPSVNSMDGVSDRDFCVELLSALSIVMLHLSRLAEELILWSGSEFAFVVMDDAFSTGSSIMPQKKNPDVAELCRGKSGRVFGALMGMLTVLKGLPLAYNKDMQEDKELIFDAVDTVKACLAVFAPMCETLTVNTKRMRDAASKGFINATDCADYLTKKGIPFRDAYRITGDIVAFCLAEGKTLETLSLDVYKRFDNLFEADIFDAINLENCVKKRGSYGGPAPESVLKQIAYFECYLSGENQGEPKA